MTQNNVNFDFLDGLTMMIDSLSKEDKNPEADHWCPDVQDWHTADHKPAQAPSVHINVPDGDGHDPYASENMEKGAGAVLAGAGKAVAAGAGHAIGEKIGEKLDKDGDAISGKPDIEQVSTAPYDEMVKAGNLSRDGNIHAPETTPRHLRTLAEPTIEGVYDQNTNLPDVKRDEGESVAEPFLRRRKDSDMEKAYEQPIDVLRIWASVDRTLLKDTEDLDVIDDLSILKSFDLDVQIDIEELVAGTLVHKMLTSRSSRPTREWWEAGMDLAKSMGGVDEPALMTAFLYYEPDDFLLDDFISKATIEESSLAGNENFQSTPVQAKGLASKPDATGQSHISQGRPRDLEMMPNSSGGDGMAGLGLSADDEQHPGPDDEECD